MPKQVKTPILDMLKGYEQEKCTRFHMPGHKGTLSPYDVTEVSGTDNLHAPKEAILEAEELLAKTYGADKSFLLVNGSTCGILAAICALFQPGDKVLVDKNCHGCVWNGLELAGAEGVVAEDLIAAADSTYKGVIVTRPDYYGNCKDIKALAKICEEKGLLLLADEAHGAHLAFGQESGYPVSAVQYAHVTVQSAHKMLGALNQTAYLHLHGKGTAYAATVRKWLSVFQTSSPSYLLLASADCARAYMEEHGAEGLKRLRDYTEKAALEIEGKTAFRVVAGANRTPDRLVINTQVGGISGYQAEVYLRTQKVQVEMSDETCIVCLCTVFDTWEDFAALIEGLKALEKAVVQGRLQTLKDLQQRQAVLKDLQDNIGKAMDRDIVPYPPGIPLVREGQELTEELYEEIARLYLAGGNLLGITTNEKGKV